MTQHGAKPAATESNWQETFVEELGALGPEMGLSRATTRITAWMMVCDPPEQSARQIKDGVELSPAAVSAATRELIAAGMLERVSRPGVSSTTGWRRAAGMPLYKPNCAP